MLRSIRAVGAALCLTLTVPAIAAAPLATRPQAVSYAAPSADQLASVLGTKSRAGARIDAKKSKLLGGGGFLIALLTAFSSLLGYSSLQAFLADAQDGILGNSPK